ncbi:MAG: hypothetical protein HN544_03660 [Euryarchaeota archaeon]|nr:hypothetical protein [Euryarchaeota archaeon]
MATRNTILIIFFGIFLIAYFAPKKDDERTNKGKVMIVNNPILSMIPPTTPSRIMWLNKATGTIVAATKKLVPAALFVSI